MNPFGEVHVKTTHTAYATQLSEQLKRMERAIESGQTITLELTSHGRTLTLTVQRERVVRAAESNHAAAAHESSTVNGLARNDSLVALSTHSYSFDLEEVKGNVTVETARTILPPTKAPELREADVSAVPNPAIRQDTHEPNSWTLAEDCTYTAKAGYTITALKEFKTDLASVPRIAWILIASTDLSVAAPTFHDLIYRSGGGAIHLPDGEVAPTTKVFVRHEADTLFLELMTLANVPAWRRYVAYHAVDYFGGSSWKA